MLGGMRRAWWMMVAASSVTAGCGSFSAILGLTKPVTRVTVELTADGTPIRAAHVRVVPMNAGPVPLPASGENIEEYLYAKGDTAATDERGRATLTLHDGSPHLIEVTAPPFGADAGMDRMGWMIEAGGGEPRATEAVPAGVELRRVKESG
jgi:hypothetical protein